MSAIPFHEIIKDARALIAEPKTWTQFEMARDAKDRGVSPLSATAVCFCTVGALTKAAVNHGVNRLRDRETILHLIADTLVELNPSAGGYSLVEINDGRFQLLPDLTPHQAVLAILDRALGDLGGD